MVVATWALAICAIIGVLAAAVKLGMDLKEVKKQVTPNGGDTDVTADRLIRIEKELVEHIRRDDFLQGEILDKLATLRPKPPTRTPRKQA